MDRGQTGIHRICSIYIHVHYNTNSKNTFTSKAKSYANAQQCDLYKNYTPARMRQQHYEVLYQSYVNQHFYQDVSETISTFKSKKII